MSSSSSEGSDSTVDPADEEADHDQGIRSSTSTKQQPSTTEHSTAGSGIPGTSAQGQPSRDNKYGIGKGMRHQFTVGKKSQDNTSSNIKKNRKKPKGISKKK